MDTIALQNQIIELQKQLEDALTKEKEIEDKRAKRREYMKKYYHANLEQERERTRQKQHKHYHNVRKPKNAILKTYELLEEIKNNNPEHLEEIKLILAN
jgi:hypothetical protein